MGVLLEEHLLGPGAGSGEGSVVVGQILEELVVVERPEMGDLSGLCSLVKGSVNSRMNEARLITENPGSH